MVGGSVNGHSHDEKSAGVPQDPENGAALRPSGPFLGARLKETRVKWDIRYTTPHPQRTTVYFTCLCYY